MGNYHAFGHSKFVPELDPAKFKAILTSSPLYDDPKSIYRATFERVWPLVEREVFALETPFASLGLPAEGGVTGYFSPSMTPEDLTDVKDFLAEIKLSPLNTRAFKLHDGSIEITVGSINKHATEHTFRGKKFKVQYGEFAPFLEEMNGYILEAAKYAANDNQREMLELYVKHF
jgi:dipeptidyl-peptidase-3